MPKRSIKDSLYDISTRRLLHGSTADGNSEIFVLSIPMPDQDTIFDKIFEYNIHNL